MWLLESDSDVFHGKKLWLRPGKKFIFGRTTTDEGGFAIENKTISRKHLIVEVGHIQSGHGAKVDGRSELILEDLSTKIGTLVNGVQIRGQRYKLGKGNEFEVKLAHYEKLFRFTWIPVILSFSFSAAELKTNPLVPICQRLEGLDIKVIPEYVPNSTTHVVAKKRNTSKGLQALVNGKYIVDHTFIDAVLQAALPNDANISALEEDFDLNWPDPLDFLPPRGNEPTQSSTDTYAPVESRQTIFEGYTFIFYKRAQFDSLHAPITNGGGKALLHAVKPGSTDPDDFIRYVKSVAGEKGVGEFEDGSEGKGVVVVRYQPAEGPLLPWYQQFILHVSLNLDHRLVEQNEFLDAILNNDPSVLRKPLEVESTAASTARHPQSSMVLPSNNDADVPMGDVPDSSFPPTDSMPAPPPRRVGRSRRVVASRFKGFDDAFDTPGDSIPESEPLTQQPESAHNNLAIEETLFVSQSESQHINFESQAHQAQSRTSRKRAASPTPEESEEDLMETVAPTAAQLKRRRLEETAARRRRGESTPPHQRVIPAPKAASSHMKLKREKKEVEIDILEVARQRREQAAELARAEREALEEAMDGVDINTIRKLAIIEEMPVVRSMPPPERRAYGDESERWEDKWNGRKNFKKFRRRGAEVVVARPSKVIVPLEEVKKMDFGIGDEYWLESGSGRKTQDRSQRQGGTNASSRVSQATAPFQISRSARAERRSPSAEDNSAAVVLLSSDNEPDLTVKGEFDDDEDDSMPLRPTRASQTLTSQPSSGGTKASRSQKLTDKTNTEQNSTASSRASVASAKRPAAETLEKAGTGKKVKAAPEPRSQAARAGATRAGSSRRLATPAEDPDADDDDDEEGLGFRFRRKR